MTVLCSGTRGLEETEIDKGQLCDYGHVTLFLTECIDSEGRSPSLGHCEEKASTIRLEIGKTGLSVSNRTKLFCLPTFQCMLADGFNGKYIRHTNTFL